MPVDCIHNASGLNGAVTSEWPNVTADDYGNPITIPNHADKTLDVYGTLGGATALIQGTHDPRAITDPANAAWKTLDDHKGNTCSYTGSFPTYLPVIYPNAYYVRVKVEGGDGTTDITFKLVSKRGL